MSVLNREAILQLAQTGQDGRPEPVSTPEWGEGTHVLVRRLSAKDRDQWETGNYDLRGKESRVTMTNARARMAVLCVVDEQGNRVFRDEDAEVLGRLHSAPLDRIYEVCRRPSGMTAEANEDLRKNSQSGQRDDSLTDSPRNLAA
jgi:hypothetical protein